METLSFAWLGTAIAGGLFPTVMVAVDLGRPPDPEVVSGGVLICFVGFFFGFLYVGMVGAALTAIAWLFAACARVERRLIWLGSLAGGWTGFLCVLPLREGLPSGPWLSVLLGTFMGQAGAAVSASAATRSNRRLLGTRAAPLEQLRVGLRQLFGAMTFFCILAAAIGAVQPTREVYELMAAAALLQAFVILMALAVRRSA